MRDTNKGMDKTAIHLVATALSLMCLEAYDGKYFWIGEVKKLALNSTCTRLVTSHTDEIKKVFQCEVRVNNLCFTHKAANMGYTV